MKFFGQIADWFTKRRHRRMIHEIALYHYRAGAQAPYSVAAHEILLRRKLEEFREFASRRYLEDRTLTLDAIKEEWLDLVVKPMAHSKFAVNDAKALKAAIVSIPNSEVFVGEAMRARLADVRSAIERARSGHVYNDAGV